ncbi:uncharacterized protein PHALS_15490 [Plasmopara halstedii]|uniref:RxLR-like protein n=1 Tax=Plasmopara halstedii TaxID=4781 RepID=A0A0P1AJ83_PLAHL|nr:uncharacterized protein PHALS_15490 [Plasmopara halstedii]CEG41148.1 hypothetical protein PHALS_15490 [Plasmopara halstedii]|eukprot:XP_024577517.1 hypothetical protein PHALS_15490 [Plasmopara halstedii]
MALHSTKLWWLLKITYVFESCRANDSVGSFLPAQTIPFQATLLALVHFTSEKVPLILIHSMSAIFDLLAAGRPVLILGLVFIAKNVQDNYWNQITIPLASN